MKDALVVMCHHPEAYLAGLKKSFAICFFPSADWFVSRDTSNYDVLKPVSFLYHKILYGRFAAPEPSDKKGLADYGVLVENPLNIGIFLIIWYIVAIGSGLFAGVLPLITRKGNSADALTLAFLVFTVLYVLVIGNFVEVIENMRFCFMTEPLVSILLAMTAQRLFDCFRVGSHN